MDLGNIIKNNRIKKHLKQSELAKMLNVNSASVSRWESNEKIPSGDTLIKLARILNIVSLLFDDYDIKKESEIPVAIQEKFLKVEEENRRLFQDNQKLWQVIRLLERSVQHVEEKIK